MLHRILLPFLLLGTLLFPRPDSLSRTADHTAASVIRITGEQDYPSFLGDQTGPYVCSGFVVGKNLVLTAKHCIGTDMRADGTPVSKIVKQSDSATDLALLSVPTYKKSLTFENNSPGVYDQLLAMGYGFGFDRQIVVMCRVIAVDYSPGEDMAPGIFVMGNYIGGMSGGPVVNQHGDVVGIAQRANEGVGYGVGTLLIRAFLLGI